ncbi:GtrA family protein [Cellulosimicrobium cellulans]|uniref:GtrA family protein n=1 Tax=Cellulosimicrobium cellulans TaxID=1710 RepID=UPI000AB5265C|nr:GtrA family protein [Cellulosimicrobium cellulans]
MRAVLGHSAFRYLLVGGFAFLLDLGLLTLAYRVLGAPLWLATAFGFWGSFAFNFTLQRRFAFGGAMPTGPALWRYCVLLGVNSLANILVVGLFERLAWGYATGKVAVTVAQTIWNYFAYKHWVFAGHRTAPTPEPVNGAATPVQHQHKEI